MIQLRPDKKILVHLFSWITLKCQNFKEFGDTAFMKEQRSLPTKGEFLKQTLAMQQCGPLYGGYTNPLEVLPASKHIDECLEELKPLLKEEPLATSKIQAAMKPISTKEGFDQYMSSTKEELGGPSKDNLEAFLIHSLAKMIHTQHNNIEAIDSVAPGWLEENFDTKNKVTVQNKKTRFLQAKNVKDKFLVVYAGHY